jgi:hypothetical protein
MRAKTVLFLLCLVGLFAVAASARAQMSLGDTDAAGTGVTSWTVSGITGISGSSVTPQSDGSLLLSIGGATVGGPYSCTVAACNADGCSTPATAFTLLVQSPGSTPAVGRQTLTDAATGNIFVLDPDLPQFRRAFGPKTGTREEMN